MTTNKPSFKDALPGLLIFAVAFLIIVAIVNSLFFSGSKKEEPAHSDHNSNHSVHEKQAEKGNGSVYSDPIKVTLGDIQVLTPVEFVDKYRGKWITFDGILFGTVAADGTKYVGIVAGNDPNDANFKGSLAMFRMPATLTTFSEPLQSYASVTPADKLNDFPKVKVTGLVTQYNSESQHVMLSDWGNQDMKNPSITQRH